MAVRPLPAGSVAPSLAVVEGGRGRTWIPAALLLVLAALAVVAVQAYIGQQGFEITKLESDVTAANERLTLLRARVAQLSTSDRLEQRGQDLGLVPATDPIFLPAPTPVAGGVEPIDTLSATKQLTAP